MVLFWHEYFFQFLYGDSLIDKVRRCRYGNTLYFFHQVSYALEFFFFRYKIHLRSKEIKVEIEDTIFRGSVVDVFIELILILYTDNIFDNPFLESWDNIISDITFIIDEFPYILKGS